VEIKKKQKIEHSQGSAFKLIVKGFGGGRETWGKTRGALTAHLTRLATLLPNDLHCVALSSRMQEGAVRFGVAKICVAKICRNLGRTFEKNNACLRVGKCMQSSTWRAKLAIGSVCPRNRQPELRCRYRPLRFS